MVNVLSAIPDGLKPILLTMWSNDAMNANWNLSPPPGFQGLCEDLPLTVYERHLPHWRQDGATYFVTFRLEDSLPQPKLRELELFKAEWERQHPPPRSADDKERLTREMMRREEVWLDQGMGSCVLRSSDVSAMLVKAMQRDDGSGHELGCFTVMPTSTPSCGP